MQVERLTTPGTRLFRGRTHDGHAVEFLDATRPEEAAARRVFVVSTLLGCPVQCRVCDAGGGYRGRVTTDELLAQVRTLAHEAFGDGPPTVAEVRVELTRMGEPAFNPAVLEFLEALPAALAPARATVLFSTVAPAGADDFFEALLAVKARSYPAGALALQVSLFSSDEAERRRVVPVKVWPFAAIADWGRRAVAPGERVTLNVPRTALPVDAERLAQVFSPEVFRVKVSELTPTDAAQASGLVVDGDDGALVAALEARGFEVERAALGTAEAGCGAYLSADQVQATPRRTLRR
jgi:23S rRNA (adenine2503-C2)-methyltransferase